MLMKKLSNKNEEVGEEQEQEEKAETETVTSA